MRVSLTALAIAWMSPSLRTVGLFTLTVIGVLFVVLLTDELLIDVLLIGIAVVIAAEAAARCPENIPPSEDSAAPIVEAVPVNPAAISSFSDGLPTCPGFKA